MHFLSLANPGVQTLSPYQPGKPVEELQRELGLKEIVKLASNENPLGPSLKSVAAIRDVMTGIARYPDGNSFRLKHALAANHGVSANQITLGNGSNDVLEIVPRVFAGSDDEIIFSQYAFAVYPLATRAVGARAVVTKAKVYGHDLDAMAAAVSPATRVIFIANPNNPTGTWLTKHELEGFLKKIPSHVIVVLDEAYFEYVSEPAYANGLDYMQHFPNLIVTRTFSKAWGLAGLRIGYALAHPDIADLLNRVRQPFNVNMLAQEAALAVLEDGEYLRKSIQVNASGLKQLARGLAAMDLNWVPSVANFITFEVGESAPGIFQSLLNKGIIVRPLANYDLPNHLRVSVGLEHENQRFLSALAEVIALQAEAKS